MPAALRRDRHRNVRPLVELLEDRLTPSWSSIPPATITPPTNYTTVNLNSAGDATGNANISASEIDWYKFTANTAGSYKFQATTPSSNLDTVIATYTATGSRVGYNDDISVSNTDSRFTVTLAAGQSFFFGTTNYTASAGGAYTWLIDGPVAGSDDAFENNDTLATAFNLGTLTTQQNYSNLKMVDAADWYRFTMNGTGTANSVAQINFLHTQGDLDLRLYNSSGTQVGSSEGTTDTESISLSGMAAGTYYVQVFGYQGVFNPNYSMTINPGTGSGGGGGGFQITLRLTGMNASQNQIFQQAAARWAQVITGDLPNASYNGITVDDVLIDASAVAMDGPGGILGSAGPDRLRSGSFLPYHGTMRFDTADLASLQSSGGLLYTIMHEMGHVLGIGTIWSQKGLITGAGGTNPRFTGAQATAQYNALFGANATSVPVENTGGQGTRDGHWREATFGKELMTGWLNSGVNPLSRITVGAMADMGYQVNMNAADSFGPGGGGGGTGGGGGGGFAAGWHRLAAELQSEHRPELQLRQTGATGAGTSAVRPVAQTTIPTAVPAFNSSVAKVKEAAQSRRTADAAFTNYDPLSSLVPALV